MNMNCPYSSVVERQSCKLEVRSSILREGIFHAQTFLYCRVTSTGILSLSLIFTTLEYIGFDLAIF